jgi:hypothetical protein
MLLSAPLKDKTRNLVIASEAWTRFPANPNNAVAETSVFRASEAGSRQVPRDAGRHTPGAPPVD